MYTADALSTVGSDLLNYTTDFVIQPLYKCYNLLEQETYRSLSKMEKEF